MLLIRQSRQEPAVNRPFGTGFGGGGAQIVTGPG
jgi:hypothetical protein